MNVRAKRIDLRPLWIEGFSKDILEDFIPQVFFPYKIVWFIGLRLPNSYGMVYYTPNSRGKRALDWTSWKISWKEEKRVRSSLAPWRGHSSRQKSVASDSLSRETGREIKIKNKASTLRIGIPLPLQLATTEARGVL